MPSSLRSRERVLDRAITQMLTSRTRGEGCGGVSIAACWNTAFNLEKHRINVVEYICIIKSDDMTAELVRQFFARF